jgi:hypothetical protein
MNHPTTGDLNADTCHLFFLSGGGFDNSSVKSVIPITPDAGARSEVKPAARSDDVVLPRVPFSHEKQTTPNLGSYQATLIL